MVSCLVLPVIAISSQSVSSFSDEQVRTTAELDWVSSTLQMTAEVPLDPRSRNAPAHPHYQEQALKRRLPAVAVSVVSGITLSSTQTVGEALRDRPELVGRLQEVADGVQSSFSRVSKDLSTLQVAFALDLYPSILQAIHRPDRPRPLPRVLSWEATDVFTGIVIYARDPLPIRGENSSTYLRPALLPDILDTGLEPILTAEHLNPNVFSERGVVTYTTSTEPADWEEVVGPQPLRVVAREVFGKYPTDVILSTQDAARLLSSESNRSILAEGRVMVIVNPAVIEESF